MPANDDRVMANGRLSLNIVRRALEKASFTVDTVNRPFSSYRSRSDIILRFDVLSSCLTSGLHVSLKIT